jgi:uncharacterized protein YoxC
MEIVTLGAVSALAVYLIVVLVRVRSILLIVEDDLKELSARALPALDNIEAITEKVRNIADNVDEQVETLKISIDAMRTIAENIVDFERRVQERVEGPILETIGTIAALIKGVQAFVGRLRA